MFKPKKAPAKRKAVARNEEDDEASSEAPRAAKKEDARGKKRAPAALSFGAEAEEGADTFVKKKPLAPPSRKAKTPPPPDTSFAAAQSSAWRTSTSGLYSAEGLAELRRSQPFQLKSARNAAAAAASRAQADVTGERNASATGASAAGAAAINGNGADSGVVLAGEEAELVGEYGDRGGLGAGSQLETELERLRRDKAAASVLEEASRREREADDFIPLDAKAPIPGSRAMSGRATALGRPGGARNTLLGQSQLEDDDEEEREASLRRWELEQASRAAGAAAAASSGIAARQSSPSPPGASFSYGNGGGGVSGTKNAGDFPAVEEVQTALKRAADRLRESGERNQRELGRAQSELAEAQKGVDDSEAKAEKAAARFEYFQHVRDRLADLAGMLRSKEDLVAQAFSAGDALRAQRLRKIVRRRAEDIEDSVLESTGAFDGFGGYEPFPGGPLAAEHASGVQMAVDEEGRDLEERREHEKERRRRGRERRRRQWRSNTRRLKRQDKLKAFRRAGWLSPPGEAAPASATPALWPEPLLEAAAAATASGGEESDAETQKEAMWRQGVLEAAAVVLSDVDLEVKSLQEMKDLFEEWKARYPKQYAQCYCSMSLPTLLEPLAKLQMIEWDPLGLYGDDGRGAAAAPTTAKKEEEQQDSQFERFEFFRVFFSYAQDLPPLPRPGSSSTGGGAAAEAADADPDAALVPSILEKVALPILRRQLAEAYDAFSERQTIAAVAAVTDLLEYGVAGSQRKSLLDAPRPVLAAAVKSLCVPLLKPINAPDASNGTSGLAVGAGAVAASMQAAAAHAASAPKRGRGGLGFAPITNPNLNGGGGVRAVDILSTAGLEEPGDGDEQDPTPPQIFWRQLWLGVKLLSNIVRWQRLVPPNELVPLALGDLVSGKLAPALLHVLRRHHVGSSAAADAQAAIAAATAERIVALVPDAWAEEAAPSTLKALHELLDEASRRASAVLPVTGRAAAAYTFASNAKQLGLEKGF